MEIVSDEPGRNLVVEETNSRMPLALSAPGSQSSSSSRRPGAASRAMLAHRSGAGRSIWPARRGWPSGYFSCSPCVGGRGSSGSRPIGRAASRCDPPTSRHLRLDPPSPSRRSARPDPRRSAGLDASRPERLGTARPLRLRLTLRTAKGRRRAIPLAPPRSVARQRSPTSL